MNEVACAIKAALQAVPFKTLYSVAEEMLSIKYASDSDVWGLVDKVRQCFRITNAECCKRITLLNLCFHRLYLPLHLLQALICFSCPLFFRSIAEM